MEDIIRMKVRKIRLGAADWIHLADDRENY
jgi:hypothetical protein